jgi:hypothetical protein
MTNEMLTEIKPLSSWHPFKLLAFRFVVIYLLLYNLQLVLQLVCFPISWVLPFVASVPGLYDQMWCPLVLWVGHAILHVRHPLMPVHWSPADSSFGYVWTFCYLALASILAGLWSIFDRSRKNYHYLAQWFQLLLRLTLAAALTIYGVDKVIPNQFPSPALHLLVLPVGELSPMNLLWVCMGYSPAYTQFAGWVEVFSAFLLVLPRLYLIGALMAATAMTNVFLLNLCYDVRVKQYSLHLLLMALILIVPHLRRWANLLIFNRRVDPAPRVMLFRQSWLNLGVVAIPPLLLALVITLQSQHAWRRHQNIVAKPLLYGIWDVDKFAINDQNNVTDSTCFRRVIFENPNCMITFPQSPTGRTTCFIYQVDEQEHKLIFGVDEGEQKNTLATKWKHKIEFLIERPTEEKLILTGVIKDKKYRIELHLVKLPLFEQKFRWISDPPY